MGDAMPGLRPPYPYFGGKSAVADLVWSRFGLVDNYVEPFFGGGAVLLGRPEPVRGLETINDINGWLCNFWRALQADPDAVAHHADWPVSELDLHARGDWLFYRAGVEDFVERLRSDPGYYDAQSAGWWVWGHCCWIGAGWGRTRAAGMGVNRKLPHLGNAGTGVNRQRPRGAKSKGEHLREYLRGLADRMREVRICCGDWSRVCGPSVTVNHGITAVFLDPPYAAEHRDPGCYNEHDDLTVSSSVREWAIATGHDRRMRIALCGYEGEHVMPDDWDCVHWKAHGGYNGRDTQGDKNRALERIWFSPHVPRPDNDLFSSVE